MTNIKLFLLHSPPLQQGSIFPVIQLSQTSTDNYNLVRMIKISSKVALRMSEVLLNHKTFSQIFVNNDFIHFPCVLITSHPLETFRIMENSLGAIFDACTIFLGNDLRLSFLSSTTFRGHSYKT